MDFRDHLFQINESSYLNEGIVDKVKELGSKLKQGAVDYKNNFFTKDYFKQNKGRLAAKLAGSFAGGALHSKFAKNPNDHYNNLTASMAGAHVGEMLYNKFTGQGLGSLDNRKDSKFHRD